MTNKELNTLQLENPSRFSKMISYLSIDDNNSYVKVIEAITTYNNLTSTAKGNYGKLDLDIPNDLGSAIVDYVRGGDE